MSSPGFGDPTEILRFFGTHQTLYWGVNLGGVLLALLSMVMMLALSERFRVEGPMGSALGALLGTVGASAFGLIALIAQLGYTTLVPVYVQNQAAGLAALRALQAIINALEGWSHISFGVGIFSFGTVMVRKNTFKAEGYLGLLTGVLYAAVALALSSVWHSIANLLAILWLISTGIVLRSERKLSDARPSPERTW